MSQSKPVQNNWPVIMTVLSLSLILSGSNAVSGAIPLMQKHFSNMSSSSVELIITIPSLASMFIPLIAGFIEEKIGKKALCLTGLGITIIGGFIPIFAESYFMILFSRLLLGVGIALFTPVSVSYIMDLYTKDKANALLGYRNSVISLGDTFMLFIAGFLLPISWHLTFAVFSLAIVPFIFLILFMPKELDHYNVNVGQLTDRQQRKQRTNVAVIVYAILFGIINLSYMAIILKLPTFIVNNHLGTPATSSFIISALTFTAIISGLLYRYIYKAWGKYTTAISSLISGIFLLVAIMMGNKYLVGACIMVAGFFWGILNPHMTGLMAESSPAGSMTLSTAIIIFGINLGDLAAPYFFKFTGTVLNSQGPDTALNVAAWLWIIFGILFTLYCKFHIKKAVNSESASN